MLNKLYSKLRLELGSSFFDEILRLGTLLEDSYIPMVKKCILLNNPAGKEAAKRDFKIQNGKMELGPDLNVRFCTWLKIAVEAEYLEGLEDVCNTWESITNAEDITSILVFYRFLAKNNRIGWDDFTRELLKEICTSERRVETLLEICIYFAGNYMVLGKLSEWMISCSIVSSFQSLIDCLKNITRVLQKQLSSTITSANISVGLSLPENLCNSFDFFIQQLNRLEYVINKIIKFINTHNDCDSKSGTIGLLMVINDNVAAMTTSYQKLQEDIDRKQADSST
ncbi:hypothetical protein PAEPH01_2375 [Pancytospora epiphaga]|nr:hypothetical protein PAEPH01_2375 [Pancytospora epiphaga]